MRFTVITVCLNAADTIGATLESVLQAGTLVAEYLVVDGGSSDGTLDIVREFEPRFDGRLKWFSEPDEGLYHAMNDALKRADEDSFVLFLGADDLLVEGSLAAVESRAGDGTGIDLVYGDVSVIEPDGSRRVERACEPPKRVGALPRSMRACHQASLFRASAYRQLGGFDTDFRLAADYEFSLRFEQAGMKSLYVPVTIAEYRLGGLSSSQGVATAEEYRRAWVLHGVSPWTARLRMMRSVINLRIMSVVRRIRRTGGEQR